MLGPLDAPPFTLVLSEKLGRCGVDVAKGPPLGVLLPKAVPVEPRFKLAERLTGILLFASSERKIVLTGLLTPQCIGTSIQTLSRISPAVPNFSRV